MISRTGNASVPRGAKLGGWGADRFQGTLNAAKRGDEDAFALIWKEYQAGPAFATYA